MVIVSVCFALALRNRDNTRSSEAEGSRLSIGL